MKGLSLSLGFDFTWKSSSSVGGSLIIFGGLCTEIDMELKLRLLINKNWKYIWLHNGKAVFVNVTSLSNKSCYISQMSKTKMDWAKIRPSTFNERGTNNISVIRLKLQHYGLQITINFYLWLIYARFLYWIFCSCCLIGANM